MTLIKTVGSKLWIQNGDNWNLVTNKNYIPVGEMNAFHIGDRVDLDDWNIFSEIDALRTFGNFTATGVGIFEGGRQALRDFFPEVAQADYLAGVEDSQRMWGVSLLSVLVGLGDLNAWPPPDMNGATALGAFSHWDEPWERQAEDWAVQHVSPIVERRQVRRKIDVSSKSYGVYRRDR